MEKAPEVWNTSSTRWAQGGRLYPDLPREKVSGAYRYRPELNRMLDRLRDGDVVTVWKLDRLARSTSNLLEMISVAGARFQIHLRALGRYHHPRGQDDHDRLRRHRRIRARPHLRVHGSRPGRRSETRSPLRTAEEDERRLTEASPEAAQGREVRARSRQNLQRPHRNPLPNSHAHRLNTLPGGGRCHASGTAKPFLKFQAKNSQGESLRRLNLRIMVTPRTIVML